MGGTPNLGIPLNPETGSLIFIDRLPLTGQIAVELFYLFYLELIIHGISPFPLLKYIGLFAGTL